MAAAVREPALARRLLFLRGEALIRTPEDVMNLNTHATRWVGTGLIGGFLLGTAVSNAQPVYVHHYYSRPVVMYRYYDPYDDFWFDSLDECQFRHGHPRVIEVIDVRSGRMVRQLRFRDGHWQRF